MLQLLAELNKLGPIDIGFFVACALIVVAIVVIYFLIPVFNKKQYQEQRDNLKKREVAFKANLNATDATNTADDASEGAQTPTDTEQAEKKD